MTNLTLVAKAITPETLAGQVSQNLVLKKDLSAVIHLPPAFTDGDEVELPVVVQNQLLDKGTLEVALSVKVDGVEWNDKKILEVKSRGRLETSFKTTIRQLQRPAQESGYLPLRSEAVFTVSAKAGRQSNVCRRSVPVLPYGRPCRVTVAGVAGGDATVAIAPSRPHWTTPTLQIAVSPNIQRSLLDLFAPAPAENAGHPLASRGVPAPGQILFIKNATEGVPYSDDATIGTEGIPAASDLMAALALAELYPANSPERHRLDEQIRTTLSLLIATQHEGIWSINGRQCTVETCGLAYWSLVLADKAGFDVPKDVLDAALGRLRGSTGSDQESDLEAKAIVLHALAISGQGDFALANHLLRDRKLLSPLARAYLALALVQMDRKETAADVLKDQPDWQAKAHSTTPGGPALRLSHPTAEPEAKEGDIEAQALTALALLGFDPASPQAKALIETILSQRAGPRWTPEQVTGPAVLATTTWLAKERPAAGPSRLTIAVNGKPLKTLDLDPQGPTQTVDVPLAMLVKGKQRIELHPSGPARLAYRCTLGGVDPAENVAGSSPAWHIERSYEPPLMEVEEQEIARGFSALSGDIYRATFSNRLTGLPAARRGFVELTVYCKNREQAAANAPGLGAAGGRELMIVEPLPSGTTVVESSLDGPFDRAEILPGRIIFYLNHRTPNSTIRYELEGVFPSSNLISPTVLRRAGRDAAVGRRQAKIAGCSAARRGAPILIASRLTSCWPLARSPNARVTSLRRPATTRNSWSPGTVNRASASRTPPTSRRSSRSWNWAWAARPRQSSCSTAKSSRRSGPASP